MANANSINNDEGAGGTTIGSGKGPLSTILNRGGNKATPGGAGANGIGNGDCQGGPARAITKVKLSGACDPDAPAGEPAGEAANP